MAILRANEIARMDEKTRTQKLKELKMELIKANVAANKTNAKTKEIKKTIARLLSIRPIIGVKAEDKKKNLGPPKPKEGKSQGNEQDLKKKESKTKNKVTKKENIKEDKDEIDKTKNENKVTKSEQDKETKKA